MYVHDFYKRFLGSGLFKALCNETQLSCSSKQLPNSSSDWCMAIYQKCKIAVVKTLLSSLTLFDLVHHPEKFKLRVAFGDLIPWTLYLKIGQEDELKKQLQSTTINEGAMTRGQIEYNVEGEFGIRREICTDHGSILTLQQLSELCL